MTDKMGPVSEAHPCSAEPSPRGWVHPAPMPPVYTTPEANLLTACIAQTAVQAPAPIVPYLYSADRASGIACQMVQKRRTTTAAVCEDKSHAVGLSRRILWAVTLGKKDVETVRETKLVAEAEHCC